MTSQNVGLLMLAAATGLNAFGLGIDAALKQAGVRTVSEFAVDNQWVAGFIIANQVVALLGAIMHLSNGHR